MTGCKMHELLIDLNYGLATEKKTTHVQRLAVLLVYGELLIKNILTNSLLQLTLRLQSRDNP